MSFWKWSQTAASNATADGSINWAEGQAPSSVNDSARAMMAAAAKFRDDVSGLLTTAGTSTAYTVASYQVFDTLAHLDGRILVVKMHADCGAAPTLNVDGLGAKAINITNGVAVPTGALKASTRYLLSYDNANSQFLLVNPFVAALLSAGIITTSMLASGAVSYATMQNVSAGVFLGGNLAGAAAAAPQENIIPFGQCRLSKSGSNLLLAPYRGNLITINSQAIKIPDAGVTLSTGGLAASTLYYIYAYLNSATLTLEPSTTAYATQAGTGVTIKSGDATRTLVGMGFTDSSTAWQDGATQRYVRSYFNDPGIALSNAFTLSRSTPSTTYVELNSEIRINFLIWAGETIQISLCGAATNNTSGNTAQTAIGIDGTTAEDAYSVAQSYGTSVLMPVAVTLTRSGLSEGQHYATVLGLCNGGGSTATWQGSGSAGTRTTLRAFAKL